MPNFSPESISADELDVLVEYLLTLEPEDNSVFEGERLQPEIGEEIVMRHWMVIVALEVDDIHSARENIEYIMQFVQSTHLQQMQAVLDALDNAEVHEAQHIVESMLADVISFDNSESTLHLYIMLSAVRADDYDEATHHFDHYMNTEDYDPNLAATLDSLLAEADYAQLETLLDSILETMSLDVGEEHESHNGDTNSESHDHD
jgi:hypothetical protein